MSETEIRQALFPLLSVFVFVFGACIGSFLNVCIWRLPRGESLVQPPSHCPKCNHRIRPWENIPLVSWLVLRARCSHCGLPISMRYPLVELATALLFFAVWLKVFQDGLPWGGLVGYFYLFAALFTITFTDIEHRVIPDAVVFPGYVVALLVAGLIPQTHLMPLVGSAAGEPLPGIFSGGVLLVLGLDRAPLPVLALADAVLGLLLGASIFLALRWAGSICWGTRTMAVTPGSRFLLTSQQITIGDGPAEELDAFFGGDRDELRAELTGLRIILRRKAGATVPELPAGSATIRLLPDDLRVAGTAIPLADIESVEGALTAASGRHEILGLGDIKLMAMIGGFLGPDAAIFILFLSALLGSVYGAAYVLARRRLAGITVPYGPFIAAGTLLWFFAGNRLVAWYGANVLGLYNTQPLL